METNSQPETVATRIDRSRHLLERSKKSLASGVSSAFRAAARPHPLFIAEGRGSRVIDADGNELIDYTLAWGPLILGHCHPAVAAAVEETQRRGWHFGAQHEGEIRVAERLVELIPCADRVAFSNTGTEAVQVAFKLARAFTGRQRILRFDGHYHGWIEAPPDTIFLPWNDITAVEEAVGRHGGEIACVILEPMLANGGCILPAEGYLAALRGITRKHGIVLIFDEVITGFRLSLRGAQDFYGVTPDLATFGKAIGAGFPLSVIAGRLEIMRLIEDGVVLHSGSFNGNPVVLAAAEAVLAELSRDNGELLRQINRRGEALMRGIERAAAGAGVPLTLRGVGSVFALRFPEDENLDDSPRKPNSPPKGRLGAWLEAAFNEGLYLLPDGRWYVSTAHSSDDVAETLEASRRAFQVAARKEIERGQS